MFIVIIQLTEFFVKTSRDSETNTMNVLILPQKAPLKKKGAHYFYFLDAVPDYNPTQSSSLIINGQLMHTASHVAQIPAIHQEELPFGGTFEFYSCQVIRLGFAKNIPFVSGEDAGWIC